MANDADNLALVMLRDIRAKLDEHDARFDAIKKRFDQRFDKVETEFETFKFQLTHIFGRRLKRVEEPA
jgi:hypothetical protein